MHIVQPDRHRLCPRPAGFPPGPSLNNGDSSWRAARHLPKIRFFQSPSTLNFQPTVFVEVGTWLKDKQVALECHDSQVRGSLMIEPDVLPGMARLTRACSLASMTLRGLCH